MASLTGSLFDEYSTLTGAEKANAIAAIGNITFDAFHYDTGEGTSSNDVYIITHSGQSISGSAGIDFVISSVSVTLAGGLEDAMLTGNSNSTLIGNSAANVLVGNDGNNLLDGRGGADTVFGGAGNDTLIGSTASDVLYGGTGVDSILGGSGNDTLDGGEGSDALYGQSGSDVIYAGIGNNTVDGGSGNDLIVSGLGNDCIQGGSGSDTINAGGGNDTVWGGTGSDVFMFASGEGVTRIMDFSTFSDSIHIESNINQSDIETPTDVMQHISADTQGNAVITFGSKVIVLENVSVNDLHPGVFIIE
jgi:Ca2+-binding RTX toxin-like protein